MCRYLTEDYEDEFKASAGYSGLKFSSQISAVEIGSMMSDVGLNISQLRILLRIFNFILLLEIDSEIARKTDPYFDQSALHRYILFKMLSLSKDFYFLGQAIDLKIEFSKQTIILNILTSTWCTYMYTISI